MSRQSGTGHSQFRTLCREYHRRGDSHHSDRPVSTSKPGIVDGSRRKELQDAPRIAQMLFRYRGRTSIQASPPGCGRKHSLHGSDLHEGRLRCGSRHTTQARHETHVFRGMTRIPRRRVTPATESA